MGDWRAVNVLAPLGRVRSWRAAARGPAGLDRRRPAVAPLPDGATVKDVIGAHKADLKAQDEYGVKYLRYWVDEKNGKVFCLAEAPDADAAVAVHREAHGLLADQIFEVVEGS